MHFNSYTYYDMDSLQVDSDMLGHHVYKNVWTPYVGKVLLVEHEDDNPEDCFAVAILKSGGIVGHVPHEMPRIV